MQPEIENFYADKGKHLDKIFQRCKERFGVQKVYMRAAAEDQYQDYLTHGTVVDMKGQAIPPHRYGWDMLARAKEIRATKRTHNFIKKHENKKVQLSKLKKERDAAVTAMKKKRMERQVVHVLYWAALVALFITLKHIWGF